MNLYVGTSGYSYKEWKGSFYPEKIPAKDMLRYYSERLSTVEINATFYRMPQPSMLENWKEQVPATFRFSLKAPQRITHFKRLKETDEETKYFLETAVSARRSTGRRALSAAAKLEEGSAAAGELSSPNCRQPRAPRLSFAIPPGSTMTYSNSCAARTGRSSFQIPTTCRRHTSTRLPTGATCDCVACNYSEENLRGVAGAHSRSELEGDVSLLQTRRRGHRAKTGGAVSSINQRKLAQLRTIRKTKNPRWLRARAKVVLLFSCLATP